jgi:hypothetical protein
MERLRPWWTRVRETNDRVVEPESFVHDASILAVQADATLTRPGPLVEAQTYIGFDG